MNAEIISVGSELLLGQIADTNAQWISQQLAEIGINVYFHHTVGDNEARLTEVMTLAQKRSDLVIVTGGLGPTDDDLTRDVAAKVLQKNLVVEESILEKIEQYFVKNNIAMSENNRKQAVVFKEGIILPNEEGMAQGMYVEHEKKSWIFLPGVPREMKSIMVKHGFPFLQKKYQMNKQIVSKVLRFIGIGESILEDRLSDIIREQTNPTIAPLAGEGEVMLRLTASCQNEAEGFAFIQVVEDKILARVGKYHYGTNDDTLESTVLQLLKQLNLSIASAESITGGRFIDRIISLPGASQVVPGSIVCYQREVKEKVLKIDEQLIEKYGTISEQCATKMAENIQQMMNSTIGISFTGNAGPDMSENKPVGTVFIGLKIGTKEVVCKKYQFTGVRNTIRNRAVKKGLELIYHYLKNNNLPTV
ncbi:competence/damage-inducible protein A [Salirhabdus euzebyi]|uniref:competence/damage-inducible protein A n=1 Tax=Salirhabdus euzebyi TaxID=394506 RepID=UPI0035DF035F